MLLDVHAAPTVDTAPRPAAAPGAPGSVAFTCDPLTGIVGVHAGAAGARGRARVQTSDGTSWMPAAAAGAPGGAPADPLVAEAARYAEGGGRCGDCGAWRALEGGPVARRPVRGSGAEPALAADADRRARDAAGAR
jgi:hypothetical protein